jgi:outer membrane immunogenic protein
MNSRVFVGGVAVAAGLVAFGVAAQAADLPARPMPAPMAPVAYAPPVYNWSGFYIGANAGGGFADSSWGDPVSGGTNSFNKNGFIGGGQLGYNLQYNWFVIGLEGDFDWTGLKGGATDSIGDQIGTKTEWTSTITGRVGAAFDRLLVYGKGGVAFAHDHNTFTDFAGVTSASANTNRTGWTAGAGLEYAIAQNWTAKLEYDYLGFGKETLNFATPNIIYASNASLNVQEIKAGINYKFNW